MFLVSNNIIVIPKVNHNLDYLSSILRSSPTKPVFKRILTKTFCQYILNMMSKRKLGRINDSIIFDLFSILHMFSHLYMVCHDIDINIFWPACFVKTLWHYWTGFNQSWKTLRSHGNLQSLLTGLINVANIGTHSKSIDWLFWMFIVSKMNPLMNKSMLFWEHV